MDSGSRVSRPTLAQVKTVVEFMQKHPDLAHRKLRYGVSHQKFKKLWIELSNIANKMDGAIKSTQGWIKFWSDKRRSIIMKQKQIEDGKIHGKLSPIEQKILNLSDSKHTSKKRKGVKQELCNSGDDDEDDESLNDTHSKDGDNELENSFPNESIEKQLNIMEKVVDAMGQQASAITQVAQAHLDHSKSLERFAEATHLQAIAVDRIASTFENISSSIHDVRNALLGIDYSMKRCYPTSAPQLRQNSNIFS